MKCPKCEQTVRRGREGLRCGKCHYEFVFDPQESERLTDGRFLGLIRAVSSNDTYYFTPNQLYAEHLRRAVQGRRVRFFTILGCSGLLAMLVVAAFIMESMWPAVVAFFAFLFGIGGTARYLRGRSPRHLDPRTFGAIVDRWQKSPLRTDKLLTEPSLSAPPPNWSEADIYDYGVERILIVQRDLLVDVFVRNQFHTEQKALVVSETGYPAYLTRVVDRLLAETPDLPVALLHDSTPDGIQMKDRLLSAAPYRLTEASLLDVGLFPRDVARMPRLKGLGSRQDPNGVPVDYLRYQFLSTALAAALGQWVPLAPLLADRNSTDGIGGDGGTFG